MVSGSVQNHRQVVRDTNRMHDIHHGGKQIRNVSKSNYLQAPLRNSSVFPYLEVGSY